MEAKDYPVTFPYGATTPPYSSAHPHTGEDRKMPLGTLIKVNGVLVGYAGTTGKSTGTHTHTQKVSNGSVVHPQGGGFEVPQPCVITETGYKADSIGYYVRYKDGNGSIWSIFHMDKQAEVHVGQQLIKREATMDTVDRGGLETIWKLAFDRTPTEAEYKNFVGKGWASVLFTAYSSEEYKNRYNGLVKNWDIVTNQVPKLNQRIKELETNSNFEPYTGEQLFTKKGQL